MSLIVACNGPGEDTTAARVTSAERFLRGVYGGDPNVVDELASDDIIVSYPIFQELFDTPVIEGRVAVKAFASGFGERWVDPVIEIHEAVGNQDRVVLMWSFRGRNVGSARADRPPTHREHNWGGISLYRFDEAGRITAEIGEESTPGPESRASAASVGMPTDHETNAAGTFRPIGPPVEPSRTRIGERCVVDLGREYALDGTLDGSMKIDYRIFVNGPCGAPPGTYNEHWIAHGQYWVDLEQRHLAGPVVYLATIPAGASIDGELVLAGQLNGVLEVRGMFEDGFMSYEGTVTRFERR